MISIGIDAEGPILKLLIERCVCGPQRASLGTCTVPNVSFSSRYFTFKMSHELYSKLVKCRASHLWDVKNLMNFMWYSKRDYTTFAEIQGTCLSSVSI